MSQPSPLNADQEIRVISLEYASKTMDYHDKMTADDLVARAGEIEKFIRGGA